MKEHKLTAEILESREFYETLINEVAPCMTLVVVCDDGKLYYWDDFVSIFLLIGEHFVAVTYAGGPGPTEWLQLLRECNQAVDNPNKMEVLAKLFNYLASLSKETGEFKLYDCRGSDWLGIYPRAKHLSLRRLFYQLPSGWPESYRSTIEKLNRGRGPDDSLESRLERLRWTNHQMISTMRFADTLAAFDAQYGLILSADEVKLSSFSMPIRTLNLCKLGERGVFRYEVDIQSARHYLSRCGCTCEAAGTIRLPSNELAEVPTYGLAAVAYLLEQLPEVAEDGIECFARYLRSILSNDIDHEEIILGLDYKQIGSGIVLLKALFEGLLCFGGDLFMSRDLERILLRMEKTLYYGPLCTAAEIQERVIMHLSRI